MNEFHSKTTKIHAYALNRITLLRIFDAVPTTISEPPSLIAYKIELNQVFITILQAQLDHGKTFSSTL